MLSGQRFAPSARARLATGQGIERWAFSGRRQALAARRAWLAPLLLSLALAACRPSGAAAQGAVKSVHNDWQIRCDTPPGAQAEQCALIQSVTAEDRANVGLTVIVLKTADKKSRLMRVVAPLGVLLPSGLGLKIDNADVGRAGFVRCLPNGCVAEVVMDDDADRQAAHRQDRDLHHLPDAGRRHRLPDEPQGLRRGLRQAAVAIPIAHACPASIRVCARIRYSRILPPQLAAAGASQCSWVSSASAPWGAHRAAPDGRRAQRHRLEPHHATRPSR